MADYKISQNPAKKPVKPATPKPKSFWAAKLQSQKLDQKNTLIILAVAGVVVVVGLVFGAIKLTSQKPTPSKAAPLISSSAAGNKAAPIVKVMTAAEYQAVKDAANDKNASLLNAYFANKVKIVIIDSNINETVAAAEAAALINDGLDSALNPWSFNVSSSQLVTWQNGPYGQYFSGTTAVGVSANGDVISVGFDSNGQINSVFIAPSSILDTGTGGSNSGSSTETVPPAPSSADAQD